MKLKIKTGQKLVNKQGFEITTATGRLENLTYAHILGVMSNPEELQIQIRFKVKFYAESEITGTINPCYDISISLDDIEALGLLTQAAAGDLTFNVIENAAYNYIINLDEYKDILEIA